MLELDIGVAKLSALDGSDFIGVQIDGLGDKPGLPPYELLHPYGFASRPLDPESNGRGCTAFYTTQGRDGFAWLANDPRIQAKLPNLRPGESCQYGPLGQFVRCHEDGSITLFTTVDGTINGHSIFLRLSPQITEDSGRVRGGIEFVSPWGGFSLGPNGFHLRHSSGARIDLGSIAGLAAPLDVLSSYITLTAAIASINATAVSQGTDAGLANDTAVTTLIALLGVMAAAIDAKSGTPSSLVAAVTAAAAELANIGKVA